MRGELPAAVFAEWEMRIEDELARFGVNGQPINTARSARLKQETLAHLQTEFERGNRALVERSKLARKDSDKEWRYLNRHVRKLVLAEARAEGLELPRGEAERWERLAWHQCRKRGVTARTLGDVDAGDLVQQTLDRLWEVYLLRKVDVRFTKLYISKAFDSVYKNACRRAARGQANRPVAGQSPPARAHAQGISLSPTGGDGLDHLPDPCHDISRIDEKVDNEERLKLLMHGLPCQEAAVMNVLRDVGLNYELAAKRLNVTQHRVRSVLSKATNNMKRTWQHWEEWTRHRLQSVLSKEADDMRRRSVALLLEEMLRGPGCRPALLDSLYNADVTEEVVKALRELARTDQDRACDCLIACYSDERLPQRHRQTSVYLLGRVRQGNCTYACELLKLKKVPDPGHSLLYRGFQIAVGFLGQVEATNAYAAGLVFRNAQRWKRAREINTWFHDYYYGGRAGTLSQLRHEIESLYPANLLALDVATLGTVSTEARDRELLERQRACLISAGVDAKLIAASAARMGLAR
jgi:DNA-directed RNA polymerase specialized sigma24 family protein